MKYLLALSLFAVCATAQTITPVPSPEPAYPGYFVSAGGGYTRNNGTPNVAEGWVSGAIGLGGGNYSVTTIDMMANVSTIRTGFAKIFSQSGNFTLMGRVDAGVQTISPVVGSFSGGAIVLYNLKGLSAKLAGIQVVTELRITGASSATQSAPGQVTPGFFFGFGKSF